MFVKDIMITDFPTLHTTDTFHDALQKFSTLKSNMIPIVDEDFILIGILTKNKLVRSLSTNISFQTPINKYVNRHPIFIYADDHIHQTRNLLLTNKIGHAPVVNNARKPIGILSTSQILFGYEKVFDQMQSQLSTLFNHLNFGLLSVDYALKVNAINPVAKQMLGINSKDQVEDIIIDNNDIHTLLENTLTNHKEAIKQKLFINGYSIFVQCFPLIERDVIIGVMVMLENMTQLEQMVEELQFTKEWEEKLRSVVSLAYDGFIIVNQRGEITLANEGFCTLFNTMEADILGEPIEDIFLGSGVHQVLNKGVKINNIAKLIHSTQCLITFLPIKNNNEIVGAVCKITYRGLKDLQSALNKVERLEKQVTFYQKELHQRKGTKYSFADIVGDSNIMTQVKDRAYAAAQSPSTVLLLGESGTGKELFANGIHVASGRAGRFVQVNCAAIPAELLESELFGYVEGAFTGAKKGGKLGKFQAAQDGTLFLDEIGDMPLTQQTKLLRVLQEKEFEPIGSNNTIKLNTKIIAATNQDLQQLIKDGKFREDLFYRLNIMTIHIPALRDRIADIQEITKAIIEDLNKNGFHLQSVTYSALSELINYHWPGNVRELYNILEQAANLTTDGFIDIEHLPNNLLSGEVPQTFNATSRVIPIEETNVFRDALDSKEKTVILNALTEANGNKAKASRILGISRTWLYAKIKQYQIKL